MKGLIIILIEVTEWVSSLLRWVPGRCGQISRRLFYRRRLAACGTKLIVNEGCYFRNEKNISLGNNVCLELNAKIFACGGKESTVKIGDNLGTNVNIMINADAGGPIVIGNNVLIGPNVVIRSANHGFASTEIPMKKQGHVAGPITIEDDVWLGANVVIVPDIHIGRGAIVAAGAVVTKNVEPSSIVGGVPARLLSSRINK